MTEVTDQVTTAQLQPPSSPSVDSLIRDSQKQSSPLGFLFWNFRHRLVRCYWYYNLKMVPHTQTRPVRGRFSATPGYQLRPWEMNLVLGAREATSQEPIILGGEDAKVGGKVCTDTGRIFASTCKSWRNITAKLHSKAHAVSNFYHHRHTYNDIRYTSNNEAMNHDIEINSLCTPFMRQTTHV